MEGERRQTQADGRMVEEAKRAGHHSRLMIPSGLATLALRLEDEGNDRAYSAFDPLAEANEVAERIDDAGFERTPWRRLNAGPHVAVAFGADLAMKRFDPLHHDANARARTAVAVMLAQMQDEIAARHLALERGPLVEAMVPIDRKAQESLIKFVSLADVEDTQDRDDPVEDDRHVPRSHRAGSPPVLRPSLGFVRE